ncbi:unnamed protein product [Camellia sinensis]
MAAKQSGLGFLDSSENSLPPPPPSLEVLPSEVSSSETYTMEPVHLSGRTLLKSNWPTFPQIFIKGEFIGGSDVILNMHQTGELKEMLKDIAANQERSEGLLKFSTGRIYLSTSCHNFRGTDMLNDGHIMIMSLAVTSTSAIAMVPFARIATTVTMMSPTMTVTSSMVTTTTATMSVMFTVNMMNMMSPAVTMMSSAMTSCKAVVFIMSTGAVWCPKL